MRGLCSSTRQFRSATVDHRRQVGRGEDAGRGREERAEQDRADHEHGGYPCNRHRRGAMLHATLFAVNQPSTDRRVKSPHERNPPRRRLPDRRDAVPRRRRARPRRPRRGWSAWIVGAGVDGIVFPGVASEFETLALEERHVLVAAVAKANAGRVPLVVGVSSPDAATSRIAHGARARAWAPPP